MRLLSLQLENFRQHISTNLEFVPGVTGIIGKNGSGKTTILEAIAWALYGGSAVRGTNETVRCRTSDGNSPVEVKLIFGLGPHTYAITRRLETSKSTASLAIDGMPARTGFKEVTESITKVLGMDYQAFFTSFFTGQKEIEFMRGMDGRQRAASISRMLGYERLVRARDRANQDKLGLQREIDVLERGLGDLDEIKRRKAEAQRSVATAEKSVADASEQEESARKEVDRLKPLRDLSEQKAKRSLELTRRMELDSAEEARAAERLKELSADLEAIKSSEAELASLAPQLEEFRRAGEEYKKLAELQKHESRRREIQGQLSAVEYDIKSFQDRMSQLSGSPEEVKKADAAVADLDRQLGDVETRIQEQRDAISAARHRAEAELAQVTAQKDEVADRRRTIEAAGRDGACPTCERPLADELPKVLAGFDDHLAKLDSRAAKLTGTLADLAKEPASLAALVTMRETFEKQREEKRSEREAAARREMELQGCEKQLADKRNYAATLKAELDKLPSGFDQDRYTSLREIGERLKPVREREIKLKADIERRATVETDLNRQQETRDRVLKEIGASKSALADLDFSQEEHEKLTVEFDKAAAQHNVILLAAERAKGDLRAAQAALTAAESDEKTYKSRETELKESRRRRLYVQTLAEAFDQLRTDLNNRAAPELAIAASELLSDLTDGRYTTLEVDGNYDATIRDDGELKQIISGGEEDIVNLSLRLAVSRMIADRAGQELSLLILDEVFGSLDDIRRENVVNLLQTLKSRFEQIIIITHVESVHDAVDNCIWVDYDETTKTSRVRTRSEEDEVSYQPSGSGI